MTNPFHDETGRFCSKEEMRGIVDSLGDAVAKQGTADGALVDRWMEMKGAYAAAEKQEAADGRADFAAPAKKAPVRIQHEALSELMEFGRIVRSDGSGAVNGQPYDHSQYVEEIQYVYSEEDGSTDDPDAPAGWEYLRGFTGQYGYNGPVMHESEYMGGRLAEHIIDNPGTYVTVAIEALPVDLDGSEEAEPIGWAVLRRLEAEPVEYEAEREKRRAN